MRELRTRITPILVATILLFGLPGLFFQSAWCAALPLVVTAVLLMSVHLARTWWLAVAAFIASSLPLLFQPIDSYGSTHTWPLWFSAISVTALALAHEHARQALLVRSRSRSRLASRVKRQAEQLSLSDSQLRQAVHESKVAQQVLLEHLPIHVVQKDLEGRFTFASQSYCRLLGKPNDLVIGKKDKDFYPNQVAQKFHADDERVIQSGVVIDDVEPTRDALGHLGYMQVRKAPLRDQSGKIIGVQAIFWDVTEDYTNRLLLQRIESRAHALIQAALDAVLIVDADGRVLEANPASEKILGLMPEQINAHPMLGTMMQMASEKSDNGTIDSTENAAILSERNLVSGVLRQATGQRIEVRLRRRDETWFEAELSAHPLTIENSTGWAIFIRDITRRKRSETELRAAMEAAEHANAAKSEFVANVSHELRTPLTAIIGLHELLERADLNQHQTEYLSLARASSNNLLALIDDLLDFAKIEANRLEIEKTKFSLIDCVEQAGTALAARAQLRGLELVIDFEQDLPELVIGDAHRVQQVLLNLVGNAIKFTQRGDICVRARRVIQSTEIAADPNTCRVRLEVIDSGIGIESHQRDLIFDAFRQADSSMTRRFGGTGLGLAISRNLVQLMGGEIGVRTEPGRGSCFYFELDFPLALRSDAAVSLMASSVVLACSNSLWRDLLEREIQSAGCSVSTMNVDQLLSKQPAHLFVAGNHTIAIVDYRELSNSHAANPPVVARWILLVPLAHPRPSSILPWLKFAEVTWLTRPVRRNELRKALAGICDSHAPTIPEATVSGDREMSSPTGQVLLVEDSPISQTVIAGMLRQLGHEVALAENGTQAIEACAKQRFDLVLMDIQMPELDGMEATRRIRQAETESTSPQKIFALTAHAMPGDRQSCQVAGMDGFLVKPISLDLLKATVNEAIGETHSSRNAINVQAISDNVTDAPDAIRAPEPGPTPNLLELLQLVGGDELLFRDVLELFKIEAPRLLKLYQERVADNNPAEARRAIHTLKSNLRYVGLENEANYVGQLEQLAKNGQLAALQIHFDPLCQLVQQSISRVEQLRQMLVQSIDDSASR